MNNILSKTPLWENEIILKKWCFDASWGFNTFMPEFNIVIFIHYKPRIAAPTPDL